MGIEALDEPGYVRLRVHDVGAEYEVGRIYEDVLPFAEHGSDVVDA
jgi:hypothetical protein